MPDRFTGEIYKDWMKSTQEKKYNDIILDFILPLKNELNFEREKILDVGVGKAWFEKKLFERGIKTNVIGLDIERTGLATEGVDFILGSGDRIPFEDESFGMVVSFDTVKLLKRPGEIERVLKGGGYALISIYCNERNLNSRKQKIKSLFDLKILKEGLVGNPEEEVSYAVLMKK